LIRQGVSVVLAPALAEPDEDVGRSLAGCGGDHVTVEPGEVDEVVYGR
jgi:hypothetical protein